MIVYLNNFPSNILSFLVFSEKKVTFLKWLSIMLSFFYKLCDTSNNDIRIETEEVFFFHVICQVCKASNNDRMKLCNRTNYLRSKRKIQFYVLFLLFCMQAGFPTFIQVVTRETNCRVNFSWTKKTNKKAQETVIQSIGNFSLIFKLGQTYVKSTSMSIECKISSFLIKYFGFDYWKTHIEHFPFRDVAKIWISPVKEGQKSHIGD